MEETQVFMKLEALTGEALGEIVDASLSALAQNIYDGRTKATAPRELIIKMKVIPTENRDAGEISVVPVLKLAPPLPIKQTIFMRQRDDGTVEMRARSGQVPGQMDMDGDEQPIPQVVSFEKFAEQKAAKAGK